MTTVTMRVPIETASATLVVKCEAAAHPSHKLIATRVEGGWEVACKCGNRLVLPDMLQTNEKARNLTPVT